MFDQSQLRKLSSALNTVLEQNKAELNQLSQDHNIRRPLKLVLQDKMKVLETAASVAVTALQQIKSLQQDKQNLIDANKNLKKDLFDLCDVNIQLEDQITKIKDQVQIQKEQLTNVQKTQEVLEKQKLLMESLLDKKLQKTQQTKNITFQGKQNQLQATKTDEIGANSEWKHKYNENVSNIKKQLQQLRKSTFDLRKRIEQNQNRIKRTLKSKKSKEQLLQQHGKLYQNEQINNKVSQNKITEIDQQTQEQTEVGNSRIRKLNSFDQKILNQLVQNLIIRPEIILDEQQKSQKQAFSKLYFQKLLKGLKNTHHYLFKKLVQDRIKTGIREVRPKRKAYKTHLQIRH